MDHTVRMRVNSTRSVQMYRFIIIFPVTAGKKKLRRCHSDTHNLPANGWKRCPSATVIWALWCLEKRTTNGYN
jgi:hypothetical protein